jgi:hypothetical protein
MTAPPIASATLSTSRNLPATGEPAKREDQFLSPRIIAREAVKILNAKGIDVGPAQLRRLVTRFVREGYTTLAEVEPFVLSHVDPTGEAAVRRVLRERGY